MQVLSNQLQRKLQDEAADISDADIEKYYKDNPDAFEQYNLDRIFVPRTKQGVEAEAAEDDDKDDKLTAQQKKAKEDAEKAKGQKNEEAMTKLADVLASPRRGGRGHRQAAEGGVRRRGHEDRISHREPAQRAPQRSASAPCRRV